MKAVMQLNQPWNKYNNFYNIIFSLCLNWWKQSKERRPALAVSLFFFRIMSGKAWYNIRQFNNIDFSSEVSTVHKFVYTDEALLLVRQ